MPQTRSCVYSFVVLFIAGLSLSAPHDDLLARTPAANVVRTNHLSDKKAAGVKKSTKKVTKKSSSPKKRIAKKAKPTKVAARRKKSGGKKIAHKAPDRSMYPLSMMIWTPPTGDLTAFPAQDKERIATAFKNGVADSYSPTQLIKAGVFTYYPLKGGIYKRRQKLTNIIMHSTETERPADAERIVRSWNRGLRHPGAQFVVERNGVIYQTVDPEYATIHVNVYRTLYGVNNDNSLGIEMVRAGSQKYTREQLASVARLVHYLQQRFDISDQQVLGHGQIQPSTRTDPVNFDWKRFVAARDLLRAHAMAPKSGILSIGKDNSALKRFFQVLTSPAYN